MSTRIHTNGHAQIISTANAGGHPIGSPEARMAIERAGRDQWGSNWKPGQHLIGADNTRPTTRRECLDCGRSIKSNMPRCAPCAKAYAKAINASGYERPNGFLFEESA